MDALHHEGFVPGKQGAEVDDFDAVRKGFRGFGGPVDPSAVGDDAEGRRFGGGLRGLCDAGFAEGNDVVGVWLDGFGAFGAGDFGPIEALVFEHDHGIRIGKSGLHQTFQIGTRGGVGHFNAPNVGQHRLHAGAMVGASGAIRADRNANHCARGPFAIGKVKRA